MSRLLKLIVISIAFAPLIAVAQTTDGTAPAAMPADHAKQATQSTVHKPTAAEMDTSESYKNPSGRVKTVSRAGFAAGQRDQDAHPNTPDLSNVQRFINPTH
jgi:hypothetical protein